MSLTFIVFGVCVSLGVNGCVVMSLSVCICCGCVCAPLVCLMHLVHVSVFVCVCLFSIYVFEINVCL